MAGFALIFVLTFLAYWPAIHGTRLWDDQAHITPAALQSLDGLHRIWFELGATQQYYPLLHSAFWLEHLFWGDATTGYHLVNLLLHAACACLVVLILRRLEIPGAWLAGAVFAVHPACVEAVAWISEQKSTLSGVFFLASALLYLDYDRTRSRSRYAAASALFLCALLSKSVTATLPAVLLVLFWWKRGRLDARRDVAPLLPWLVLGAASGLFTAWVERRYIHAEGAAFSFTIPDRILLAGRLPWHYLAHLLWPVNLSFFYSRFPIDTGSPLSYLFPAATLLTLAAFVHLARRTTRAPLAAALLFGGMLFPVLGFLNVYPFLYSWVADHFGYLASLAVIAPVCALLTHYARQYTKAASAALLAALAILTWNQSRDYRDIETLWRATIDRTPSAWMAHYNLAVIYGADPARRMDAIVQYRETLEYNPDLFRAHSNLAAFLADTPEGLPEALTEYETALRLAPRAAAVHSGYGVALLKAGRTADAIAHLKTAAELSPDSIEICNTVAIALAGAGKLDEAEGVLRNTMRADPAAPEPHNTLGRVLLAKPARAADAIAEFREALRLRPVYRDARFNLAGALAVQPGKLAEAITEYQTLLRDFPADAPGHYQLALAYTQVPAKHDAVIPELETALRLNPANAEAHYNLAVALSSLPNRLPEVIAHLEEAQRLNPASPQFAQALDQARQMQQQMQQGRRRYY